MLLGSVSNGAAAFGDFRCSAPFRQVLAVVEPREHQRVRCDVIAGGVFRDRRSGCMIAPMTGLIAPDAVRSSLR